MNLESTCGRKNRKNSSPANMPNFLSRIRQDIPDRFLGALAVALAFMAFLYGFVRAFGVTAAAAGTACVLAFLANSFEALDRAIVWWDDGAIVPFSAVPLQSCEQFPLHPALKIRAGLWGRHIELRRDGQRMAHVFPGPADTYVSKGAGLRQALGYNSVTMLAD